MPNKVVFCVFGVAFTFMLHHGFSDSDHCVYLLVRTDGGVFSLTRFLPRTKTPEMLIGDVLFADGFALSAHSLEDIQSL